MSKKELSPGAEKRKYLNAVYVSGIAVIAFGIWDMIKIILGMISFSSNYLQTNPSGKPESTLRIAFDVVWIAIALIIVISLSLRLYVGRSAMSEGKGNKKKAVYLVVAAVMTVVNCAAVLFEVIIAIQSGLSGIVSNVIALIVDITSVIVFFVLLYSAVKSRRLSKKEEKEASE